MQCDNQDEGPAQAEDENNQILAYRVTLLVGTR